MPPFAFDAVGMRVVVAATAATTGVYLAGGYPASAPSVPIQLVAARASPCRSLFASPGFGAATAFCDSGAELEGRRKPSVCTADELHYAPVPGTSWRLALWRYIPPPEAPKRNHPLMLLSGVATNAIGFDLSPGASFARYMCSQGFDTWVVEVRGAGLSMRDSECVADESNSVAYAQNGSDGNANYGSNDRTADKIRNSDKQPTDKFQLEKGLSEPRQSSYVSEQIRDFFMRIVDVLEEGQRTVSSPLADLQERLNTALDDFHKVVGSIQSYDWDFDNYLEEDIPVAMDYIRNHSRTKDGKILAIGHSMGGILLYAMVSQCVSKGVEPCLRAIVTIGSSVDYTTSNSSLKLLLPLAEPAQALNVPAVPLGVMLAAVHPVSSRVPYVLSWLNNQISAEDMMHPELFSRLILKNFCTVPAKVLLQLSSAFQNGGLRNRTGAFYYKDYLQKCNVPVLAIAGDKDLICPPEAVYETVRIIPPDMVTYKLFGSPQGPHYAHYDLVGGRKAPEEVYPCIITFLTHHD